MIFRLQVHSIWIPICCGAVEGLAHPMVGSRGQPSYSWSLTEVGYHTQGHSFVIIVAFYGSKSHTVFIISIEESQLAYVKAIGNPTLEGCAPE